MNMTKEDRRRLKGGVVAAEPIALSIPEAQKLSGLRRSELYRRLASGDIQAIKSGSRTLIFMESLRAHIASLPPATFRAPRQAT
jgi:predicted DNA-binding transcriptional regulator AlpA